MPAVLGALGRETLLYHRLCQMEAISHFSQHAYGQADDSSSTGKKGINAMEAAGLCQEAGGGPSSALCCAIFLMLEIFSCS